MANSSVDDMIICGNKGKVNVDIHLYTEILFYKVHKPVAF